MNPPLPAARRIRLAMFDMDGVIFEGRNFWLDLHTAYGTEEAGVALADRYMTNDYARLAELVAGSLWRGLPAAPFEALVAERLYQPGVDALFAELHVLGIATALVTSGPAQLAERAQRDLGIDVIRANHVLVSGGSITGEALIEVPDADKERVGLEVMEACGADPGETAFVGDTDSDAALAAIVGVAIAYDSDAASLRAVADHVVPHGQLPSVARILGRSLPPELPRHQPC